MTNEDILKIIDERDLHSVLNNFCMNNLDIHAKTIFHERSAKNKGKAEWLHPDMVGFQLTTSNWDSNIIEVCKDFYVSKAILYSFELKKNICLDTLREYYFQAVSNSSWSNEGYLVTASLDENNTELMNEIKRLVGAFGIGIIKLDILNPQNSNILFSAKRRDSLDGETMNKLYVINPDYRDFIQVVINSLKINHIVNQHWDDVNIYDKLLKSVYSQLNKTKIDNHKHKICDNPYVNFSELQSQTIKEITFDILNPKLEFTKPIYCKIKDKIYTPKGWSNLLILIYKDLKEENDELFKTIIKSNSTFSFESKKDYVYKKELDIYYLNRNANNTFKEIVSLLNSLNIELNKCILRYEYKNK